MYALEAGSGAISGADVIGSLLPVMLIVVGAPLGLWWWMRRGRRGVTHRLRITDKAALGRNTWVAVVEIDDKRFLLGAGESGVGLISELEALPQEVVAPMTEPLDLDALASIDPERAEEMAALDMNGSIEQPRMGFVRRLQLMTLRSSARPVVRPFGATRR